MYRQQDLDRLRNEATTLELFIYRQKGQREAEEKAEQGKADTETGEQPPEQN
jgi:hypothetical protein